MNKNKKGFTLTEILIVLVIAGILLALILPNSLRAIQRGNVVADDSNVQSCRTAIMLCYSENNRDWSQCNTMDALVDGGFLREAPPGVVVAADAEVAGAFTCNLGAGG